MTLPATLDLVEPAAARHRSFRLTRPGTPSLSTAVRPALVLPEREGRALLEAAAREDVSQGGCWSAGPAGVQLWSAPWTDGRRGTSQHLGSVDWSYDTPVKHYITVYRVLLTAAGAGSGLDAAQLLARVLDLAGVRPAQDEPLPLAVPAPRDPFRSLYRPL